MIRKLFALLALVGLAAAPSTTWAYGYGTLTVEASPSDGGLVLASNSAVTEPVFVSSTSVSDYIRVGGIISSKGDATFYAYAQPNEGYKFAGWYESDLSTPITGSADGISYTWSVSGGSTKSPATKKIYAKFIPAGQKTQIAEAAISLSSTSLNYTGSDQTVSIVTDLVLGEDYTVSGPLTAKGSPSKDEEYEVTITGIGDDYEGTVTKTWTIKAPSGSFAGDAAKPTKGSADDQSWASTDGNMITVSDSTKLLYNADAKAWFVGMTLKWPSTIGSYIQVSKTYNSYTDVSRVRVEIGNSLSKEVKYLTGSEIKADPQQTQGELIDISTANTAHISDNFTYVSSLTWYARIDPETFGTAKAAGTEYVDFTLTAYGLAWDWNADGVARTTFTIRVPVENLTLNDQYGNQVYPHVDFVAENGTSHKKFETLAAALTAANAGETVTLIANAEADEFAIGPGVTLNLAGFGNASATYLLKPSEDAVAMLKSTKAESVTTTTGYEVVTDAETEPGVYIYTTKLDHQHAWTFEVAEDGYTLVASCQNPACTIEGAKLTMQLQGVADKEYDGSGISPSVVDIDVGGNKFREVIEGVTVGEFTYARPEYSAEKWYTGAYTASCVVTIGEGNYTLTKDFNILPKEYTDGFVASVGGLSVRFDTLLEASGAANEKDTIYYKGGNLTGREVTFSSSKNITLDLGGAALKHDAYEAATLKNSGAGTVTLTNGTIVQPKSDGLFGSAGQMEIEGNFAFADIETKNRATSYANFFTMTVKSGTVTVLGGKYTSQFKTDGGTVVYQGGKFWDGKYNNRAYFSEPTPDTDYIVIPGTESMDDGNGDSRALVWEVVAHTHDIVYTAAGNVITASCNTNNHEHCGFGTPTVTLTADPAKTSGEAYAGAHVAVTAGFPVAVTDADITYWQGEQKLEGAPIETGDYIAKVTVGGATAEQAFQIVHEHVFKFDEAGDTLTATCTAEGVCDAKTLTLTLVAESRDWKKATPLVASVMDGFGETIAHEVGEYAYYKRGEEAPLGGAPILTGEYTVKVTVTVAETPYVLTKDFAITKPAGGYTSGYEVKDGLCYDSLEDAIAAAGKGDTIYWRDGGSADISTASIDFNSENDITVDLCGKRIYQQYNSIELKNSQVGVITLTNGKVAVAYTNPIKVTGGAFVFEQGLYCYSTKAFSVSNGAKLEIVGGEYSEKCTPNNYVEALGDEYVVLPISDGNYDWKVVPHEHKLAYAANANVITVVCTNENAAYCNYKPDNAEKLTLTAETLQETGSAYAGAKIEYSAKFPVKDAEIEYWEKDGEKLGGAPSEVGFYEARVTVSGVTAVAAFEITHIHEFEYKAVDAMNIGVKCKVVGGSCDYQEVKTVTLNAADTKTFDGAAYAATFTKGEGFPSEDLVKVAIEYWVKNGEKLESAPSDFGSYTVKMIASEGGPAKYTLEKDFDIVQADLASATITLSNTRFDFDGTVKSVTVSSVKLGNYSLTEGVDYTVDLSSVFAAEGSGVTDDTYAVKIVAVDGGNFTGEATATWTIVAGKERDDFKFGAGTAGGEYGEVADKTLSVTDSTKLVYNGDGTWSMKMNVTLPTDGNVREHFVPTIRLCLRNPQTGEIVIGSDADACKGIGVDVTSAKTLVGDYYYVSKLTWTETVSLAEIEAAIAAGDEKIVRTLKMWSPKWEQEIIRNVLTYDNHNGLPVTEYKMELPLDGLVLPVPAEKTLDAGDVAINDFKLQLGKKATVTANAQVSDFAEKIVSDGTAGYAVTESGEGPYTYENGAVSYQIAYLFEGNDGQEPTNPNPTSYTVESETIAFQPATLDGYEFVGWNPEKIAKGTTGKQTITGTFKRSITPTAQVAEMTPVPDGLDVAATFTLGEYAENYSDWKADFILTADQNLAKDAITLKGEIPSQTTDWVPLALAVDYTAGTSLSIIGLAMAKLPLALPVYYWELKDMGTFNCGLVANKIEVETKVTVSLVLSKEGEDPMTLATFETTLQKTSTPYEDVVINDTDDGKTVTPEVKQAAAEKVEELCNGDEANIDEVKTWVKGNNVKAADLAKSEYTKASYDLGVALLDKGESVAEVAFDDVAEDSTNGFSFKIAVQFEGELTPEVVNAAKEKVSKYIFTTGDLVDEFRPVDAGRVEIDPATGKVTITPAEGKTSEFFKVVIPKDPGAAE